MSESHGFGQPAASPAEEHLLNRAAPFLRDALCILVHVCHAMDADVDGPGVSEEQYQAALAIADAVLSITPAARAD